MAWEMHVHKYTHYMQEKNLQFYQEVIIIITTKTIFLYDNIENL
jgi:hypothetical protein